MGRKLVACARPWITRCECIGFGWFPKALRWRNGCDDVGREHLVRCGFGVERICVRFGFRQPGKFVRWREYKHQQPRRCEHCPMGWKLMVCRGDWNGPAGLLDRVRQVWSFVRRG